MKSVLTYSAIRNADCLRKYKLRQIDCLRPVARKKSLMIGGLYHYGREHGLLSMLDKLHTESHILSQTDMDKQSIMAATLTGMLMGASLAFQDTDLVREPEWLLPIINPDTGRQSKKFAIGGKADGLNEADGLVVEEKTTAKSVGESEIMRLPLDQQVLNEVACLQRARGITINKVYYRFIVKPFIRQKQTEAVAEYCERLVDDYQARPEFYFHEEVLLVDRARVLDWERNLWQIAQMLHFAYVRNGFYMNTSRCSEWGGCQYLPICRGDDTDGLYEVSEVNPELRKVSCEIA